MNVAPHASAGSVYEPYRPCVVQRHRGPCPAGDLASRPWAGQPQCGTTIAVPRRSASRSSTAQFVAFLVRGFSDATSRLLRLSTHRPPRRRAGPTSILDEQVRSAASASGVDRPGAPTLKRPVTGRRQAWTRRSRAARPARRALVAGESGSRLRGLGGATCSRRCDGRHGNTPARDGQGCRAGRRRAVIQDRREPADAGATRRRVCGSPYARPRPCRDQPACRVRRWWP